jgi:ureidoacrylate peracid hydrolase
VSISAEKTALIVVDMQNGFLLKGAPIEVAEGRAIIRQLNDFVGRCRRRGILVVFTKMNHEHPGLQVEVRPQDFGPGGKSFLTDGSMWSEIHRGLKVETEDIVLRKHRYSAFYNTELEDILKGRGINTVIISGVATNICVESTARDAFFRDFRVVFLSDLTATWDKDLHRGTLVNIRQFFGRVTSSGQIAFQESLLPRVAVR